MCLQKKRKQSIFKQKKARHLEDATLKITIF